MRNEIEKILRYNVYRYRKYGSEQEATDQILSLLEGSLPEERLGNTTNPALLHYVDEERWANGWNACLQEIKEKIQ